MYCCGWVLGGGVLMRDMIPRKEQEVVGSRLVVSVFCLPSCMQGYFAALRIIPLWTDHDPPLLKVREELVVGVVAAAIPSDTLLVGGAIDVNQLSSLRPRFRSTLRPSSRVIIFRVNITWLQVSPPHTASRVPA